MVNRFSRTLGLSLAALALVGVARIDRAHRNASSATFSYALQVSADCNLMLRTSGVIAFGSISSSGSGEEIARNNQATTNCEAGSARLNVYDSSPTGTTTYTLQAGSHKIPFEICPGTGNGAKCYTNSDEPGAGIPIANGPLTTNIRGRLNAQGPNSPGAYVDVVTVSLTFT